MRSTDPSEWVGVTLLHCSSHFSGKLRVKEPIWQKMWQNSSPELIFEFSLIHLHLSHHVLFVFLYLLCKHTLLEGGNGWFVLGYFCNVIDFVSLQHDDAAKQCQDLSQELVNLRGELGKLVRHDHNSSFQPTVGITLHLPTCVFHV